MQRNIERFLDRNSKTIEWIKIILGFVVIVSMGTYLCMLINDTKVTKAQITMSDGTVKIVNVKQYKTYRNGTFTVVDDNGILYSSGNTNIIVK